MKAWPRVAFFADSFHGVDGVGMTSRSIVKAAGRRGVPLLSIRNGDRTRRWQDGSVEILELAQGPVSVGLDSSLRFDLLFMRHFGRALQAARAFGADVVHITSPGDIGITGAWVAEALQLPLVASWHTNIPAFGAWRLWKATGFLPGKQRRALSDFAQKRALWACLQFYGMAQVLLAPNEEDARMLNRETGRPTLPMSRGADASLFSRSKRSVHDNTFRLGFVGRLRPEKNVRFLVDVEAALRRDGLDNYRFLIVGDGSERAWLERKLMRADFTGELFGENLAGAYANMDLFVFPSETDTYGNVVREALTSGTPAIVTSKGGPKYQIQDGVNGFVAADEQDFIAKVKLLVTNRKRYLSLCASTRSRTGGKSWEDVLDELHEAYQESLWCYASRGALFAARRTPRGRFPSAPDSTPTLVDN